MKIIVGIAIIAVAGLLWFVGAGRGASNARSSPDSISSATVNDANQPSASGDTVPVLVELFTSEGCSSCPPADELLSALEKDQPIAGARIIALSEHVDYWNHLGWADPYSSREFSERQNQYASALGKDGVYTPQMIVDGKAEFVGSNLNSAREAITKAARETKPELSISRANDQKPASTKLQLLVQTPGLPAASQPGSRGDTVDVLLAITEDGLASSVARGENAGRKLAHTAVVRKLISLGTITPGHAFKANADITLERSWRREHLRAVAFAQRRTNRAVLAAAELKLAQE